MVQPVAGQSIRSAVIVFALGHDTTLQQGGKSCKLGLTLADVI
jgi:hypothetical protein